MIADFLQRLRPGGPWVLTAIVPDGKTDTQTFADASQAQAWALAGNQQANLYLHVNPTTGPVGKKATKEQIAALEFLHVDLDPRTGEDFAQERARILALLTDHRPEGIPAPTLIVDSGGGYQAWWRLAEPIPLNGDLSKAEEAERWNRALERAFGADHCHNCDRVLRLPGTTNWPNRKKRDKGRAPTRAEVQGWPAEGDGYPLTAFRVPLPPPKAAAVPATASRGAPNCAALAVGTPMGTEELRAWAAANGRTIPDGPLAVLVHGRDCDPGKYPSRSEALWAVVCGLARAGLPDELIVAAIMDPNNKASACVLDKRNPGAEAWGQVTKARDAVSREGDRDPLAAARRAHQVEENRRIGEGAATLPPAELIELDAALSRFVFCSDGSRVVDVFNPHYDLPLHDWQATYAASKVTVARPPKVLAGGGTKEQEPASVPLAKVWMSHPERRTVITRTFKAGGPLVLPDPGGRLAVNSWRPFDRSLTVADLDAAGLGLFLDHVAFLFGEDAPRFLDWLAHIEQKPGELPHTSWLHIARKFGMGRNWLASVLTRVWAGSVAPNFDLVASLKSGFNGGLSRKVLAIVDEIREGGRDAQWEHSEKMKGLITEETRTINPKYGRQSVEFNACRWLLFSNHLSAIPMENGDRRIEVVVNEAMPHPADYYTALYRALNEPTFIAAVATFLGRRDLSAFNPGAHARLSEAKREAIQASQSPDAYWAELIAHHWPCDVAPNDALAAVFHADADNGGGLLASQRRALAAADIVALGKPIWLERGSSRLSVVRNKTRWKAAPDKEIRAEWERGEAVAKKATHGRGWAGWRNYLMGCAAGGPAEGTADQPRLPF